MKVALIGNAYPPDFVGGTEIVMRAQARALRDKGHNVRVIVGSDATDANAASCVSQVDGIELVRIPRLACERDALQWKRARVAQLVEEACDESELVHVHHASQLSGDLVRRLVQQKPVFLTLHDHFASCPRHFRSPQAGATCPRDVPTQSCVKCIATDLPGVAHSLLEERLLARWHDQRAEVSAATCVIAPSEHLRETLGDELRLNWRRWKVVAHGMCRDWSPPKTTRMPDGVLTVLSFGNRTDVKGTSDLVRALARLPIGSVRLLLAGREVRAGYDDELRELAGPLELQILGAYDKDGLRQLAAHADIAAFPSRAAESYGLVVEEALALGLPTWVSDRGALAEALRAAAARDQLSNGKLPGAILPAQDPAAWSNSLRALVESPGKLQDARACLPASIRTAANAVDELLEFYDEARAASAIHAHSDPCRSHDH